MRDMYPFIVGGGLAVLGGARLRFITIARRGIWMFGSEGTKIQISFLAITALDLSVTRVLPHSCWYPSPDSRCGGPSTC